MKSSPPAAETAPDSGVDGHRQALLEHCPDVIFEMRVEDGPRFVQETYNPAALAAIRRSIEDVRGREPKDFMPPEAAASVTAHYLECYRTGKRQNYENELDFGDGTRIFDTYLIPVFDTTGRVVKILGFAREITERRRAEFALRDSEKKFSTTFLAIPYSVSISDLTTGRYLDANPGFERISGYCRDEIIGKTSIELNLWVDPNDREEFIRRMMNDGKVRALEIRFRAKDGRIIFALCNCDRIELDGRPCAVNTFEDITAKKQAARELAELEEQLRQAQKLEALGTLAGGIAHDFNNILAACFNYTELALLDIDQPELVREHLTEVNLANTRTRDLVRQILTFSRRQKQERKKESLVLVVTEALRLLQPTLPKLLSIETRIDPDTPSILADSTQIHQVIMNLSTNAAHAMKGKPGKLRITVGLSENGKDARVTEGSCRYARLTIEDDGIGMSEETLRHIYDPFFTTKPQGEGTGLGLSVVHGIVQDHQGIILVESKVGIGTRFDLFFPEYEAGIQSETPSKPSSPTGNGQHILLVDDELQLSASSKTGLERLGFAVTVINNPHAALQTFRASPERFAAVVTDLSMPGMSGLELCREILLESPITPVLLLSGHSEGISPETIPAYGPRELLHKPTSLGALATALNRALRTPS